MSILNPQVVVVIPTLNAGAPLAACLAALRLQTFREFETIVVDNGGKAEAACATVLRPGNNIGYGAAINLGAGTSTAPLIVALNDDAVPEPQWLAELVRAMDAYPNAGMCACCVLLDDTRLDSAGLLLCGDGSTKQRGHREPASRYATETEALMPSGSAGMYRRELFRQAGGFEESFFLYCEDSDLGLRAQWLGWGCRYEPLARVRHGYSVSAGRASSLKAFLVERNRLALAIRCLPLTMLWRAPLVAARRYLWHARLPSGAAHEFRQQSSAFALPWLVLKAHLATLAALPRLIAERRRITAQRRISPADFLQLATRHAISPRQVAEQ